MTAAPLANEAEKRLFGKKALITGGSSGIGLATAKLFQAEGAQVAVTGRDTESLARAAGLLGSEALVCASDTGNLADIDDLMETIAKEFGRLDVLVLNAGGSGGPAPFETMTEISFDRSLATNFRGPFFTLQKALPLLDEGSSVIVTTSITNQLATPNFSAYGACKAALRSLVATLAIELLPRAIRVNAVSPGPISTPGFNRAFERAGLPAGGGQAIREDAERKTPLRRFGTADEIAKAILFLASDDASYIVGEEIVIDGGICQLWGA